MKVRLKLGLIWNAGDVSEFQFHEGPIKTSLNTLVVSRPLVSIP